MNNLSRKDHLFGENHAATLRAIATTERVSALYPSFASLPPKQKIEVNAFLRSFFSDIQKLSDLSLLDSLKDSLKNKVSTDIGKISIELAARIDDLYIKTLVGSQLDEIQNLGHSYYHDLSGVLVNPIKFPPRKTKDPVVLVSLQRPTIKKNDAYEYVIKQTHPEEYLCHTLMKKFSELLGEGFKVPLACAFYNKTHITPSLDTIPLKEEESASLHSSFENLFLKGKMALKPLIEGRFITLFERINGIGFSQFSDRVYREDIAPYPTQKFQFFHQIAQIAALDLILGNQDRWNLVDFFDSPPFKLMPPSSNNIDNMLINLPKFKMSIDFSDEALDTKELEIPLSIYAIDNGILGAEEVDFIKNPELRTAYNEFIKELFTEESPLEKLADALTASCKLFEEDDAFPTLMADLKPTVGDKGSFAHSIFIETFNQTFQSIPEIWHSLELDSIKTLMKQLEPELFAIFDERITLFHTIYRKNIG